MTIETRTEAETIEVKRTREGHEWSETYTDYETREVEVDYLVCDLRLSDCNHDIGPVESPGKHALLTVDPTIRDVEVQNVGEFITQFGNKLDKHGTTIRAEDAPIDIADLSGWTFRATYQKPPRTKPDSYNPSHRPTRTMHFSEDLRDVIDNVALDALERPTPTLSVNAERHVCPSCADAIGLECTAGGITIESDESDDAEEDEEESALKQAIILFGGGTLVGIILSYIHPIIGGFWLLLCYFMVIDLVYRHLRGRGPRRQLSN